jgi:hypothetical protein
MNSNQIFIISWTGQHENAAAISKSLEFTDADIFIIYSDPNPDFSIDTRATLIRRDNNFYFGDKFQACLDNFTGDKMLLIHADCKCSDWPKLVQRGFQIVSDNPDIWIWSPRINYTGFNLEKTGILQHRVKDLFAVVHTDTILFCWNKSVVERLKHTNLKGNDYGWGIGWIAVAFAYANKGIAVIDSSIDVEHPKARGYETNDANKKRNEYLKQLTFREALFCRIFSSHMTVNSLANKY